MSDVLGDLVGDRDQFATTVWNRRPAVRRKVPAEVWDGLIGLGDLDHLLASRRGDLHLLKDAAWVDRARYTRQARPGPMLLRTEVVDTSNLFREFSDGATIVLIGAHEWWPPLDRLCAQLARSMTMPVQANIYVAPPGLTGHRHHDLHHIFALQLHGTKQWTIEGGPEAPDRSPEDAATMNLEVHPGDCLYVPRRFPHSVRTTESYSTHVTFGVVAPTWSEVISKIVRDQLPTDLGEQPLPPGFAHLDNVRAVLEREAADALAATREVVGRWSTAELVGEATERFGFVPERTWDGHYESLVGSAALTASALLARRPDVQYELVAAGGVLRVELTDRTLEMPAWLLPAVTRALSGQPFRIVDLHQHMDHASARVLARRLLRDGVLQLLRDAAS